MKRFIAGAVCPKCGEMDCIKAETDPVNGVMKRECVSCGYQDEMITSSLDEIDTRVTPKPQKPVVEAQVIRLIDPSESETKSE